MTDSAFLARKESDPLHVPSQNEQLAVFIPEADVPVALKGGVPALPRTFRVQVARDVVHKHTDSATFRSLKEVMRRQNESLTAKVKRDMPSVYDRIGRGLAANFDTDVQLSVGSVVPLPPHQESVRTLAVSMFTRTEVVPRSGGEPAAYTSVVTTTIANLRGKVLFFYCFGAENDLEWTRTAAGLWTAEILKLNPSGPAVDAKRFFPPAFSDFDWDRILGRALAGCIVGAVVATGALLLRLRR